MNTAPVAAPPASVTVAPGVTVDSSMTPEQRFQAILKANVQPHQLGIGHTDHNVAGMSAAAANPPPSPAALEAANKHANVVDALITEMRVANGLPLEPSDIDQSYLTKLNARYTELMRNMEKMPPSEAKDRNIAKIRGEYDAELREVYEGRRLGEKRSEFRARRDGTAAVPLPVANKPAATTANMPAGWDAAIEVATKASNKYGYAPASAITGPLLHGYSIPAGREYHVADLVDSLRMARKGNLTQQQVSDIAGWSKA